MNLDFPMILVMATAVTGLIWLLDVLILAPKRRQADSATAPAHQVSEPWFVDYSRSFFPVILAVLVLRSFVVEPFRIPSGSMMPTLLVGDFILVNKFAYGLRWPVLNHRFFDLGEPQPGDVIVFRFPQNEEIDYIKRVVGTPGDRIFYRNKMLFVNDQPMGQLALGTYIGTGAGKEQTGVQEAWEDLNGVKHKILINDQVPDFPLGCEVLVHQPFVVPDGHYFVMGDNRDNSFDSRCWGLVPEENLVGKAFAIWMNWDIQLDGWPINWHRIGNVIH
jgi:signal peptidase I